MSTLKRYYQLLFYRLYKWHYNKFGEDDLPALTAMCYMSLLLAFNVTTILIIIDRIMPVNFIINTFFSNNFWKILYALGILVANYFFLCYKGKDKKIISEQEKLNKAIKKRDTIILVIYIIITPIIFVFTLIYPSLI